MAETDPDNKRAPAEEYDPAELIHLARAIVEQRAIVYVGAGASMPSGAPSWSDLLRWLYENGAKPLLKQDPASTKYMEDRLGKEKMFLEAADLLQDILDNDLSVFLSEKFDDVSTPSSIHINIGRIPFAAAITTNYDDLLEKAYENSISGRHRPSVMTWNEPVDILQNIRENKRFVLKTHGRITDQTSLVLSSRQYRDLIHANPLYWQILKSIFMTKTCLFVGCSLTDPDLLQVFEEVVTEIGKEGFGAFGPHYALLPASEAPSIKVSNLFHQLKIRVIALKEPAGQDGDPANSDERKNRHDQDTMKWVEAAAARVLVGLAGEVARQTVTTRPPPLPTSDDAGFFLNEALKKLLQTALDVTGSFRGDICLHDSKELRPRAPTQEHGEKLEAAELRFRVSLGPTNTGLERQPVNRRSVCGIAFYEATPGQGVNLPDVKHPRLKRGSLWHWGNIDYLAGHPEVKSELAMPILADGVRVGVLNLESIVQGAYGPGHVFAAHWYSEKAGRLFGAAVERNRRGRALHPTVAGRIHDVFVQLLRELWTLRPGREGCVSDPIDCLVFYADYIDGTLEAAIPNGKVLGSNPKATPRAVKTNQKVLDNRISFSFGEKPSLTADVFRKRSGIFCRDATQAIQKGLIAERYVGVLELSGAAMGFPIYIRGYTAGVLACWYRNGEGGELDWRDMEVFRRASHLLANASAKDSMLKPLRDLARPGPGQNPPEQQELRTEEDVRFQLFRQHIEGARETIDFCISNPVVQELHADEACTNPVLERAWREVARQIASLLELLWIRYGQYEEHWLVPTRARLWIASAKRTIDDGDGKDEEPALPIFGLVVEVSLAKENLEAARKAFLADSLQVGSNGAWRERWAVCVKAQDLIPTIKNLPIKPGETTAKFRISLPEPWDDGVAASTEDGEPDVPPQPISVDDFIPARKDKLSGEEDGRIPKDTTTDPDFSFLLSRQWADPYARFQKPGPSGDSLAWIKSTKDQEGHSQADPTNPRICIYAAPIIMIEGQPQAPTGDGEAEPKLLVVENELRRSKLREPIGMLALDRPLEDLTTEASESPTEESHITLQRELLHTIDLFTACLADRAEFRSLGGRAETKVASGQCSSKGHAASGGHS